MEIKDLEGVTKVCAAFYHTVAITAKGQVYAWGNNGSSIDDFYRNSLPKKCVGLIRNGDSKECFWTPVEVKGFESKAKDVSAGFAHSSVVTEDGTLYTWGFGYFAVLGVGDREGRPVPTVVRFPKSLDEKTNKMTEELKDIKIEAVVCGLIHTIALDDQGRLWTFGMGGHSQLGHGDQKWQDYPKLVEYLAKEGKIAEKCISAGTYQTAVVLQNGQVYVAGSYLLGALGLGDVHRPQMSFRIVGSLLGRENHNVSCGNHFLAAF